MYALLQPEVARCGQDVLESVGVWCLAISETLRCSSHRLPRAIVVPRKCHRDLMILFGRKWPLSSLCKDASSYAIVSQNKSGRAYLRHLQEVLVLLPATYSVKSGDWSGGCRLTLAISPSR
jgi:hypothetical protein